MVTADRVNQLCRDADPVAALPDAAFEDIAHAKLGPNLPYVG